MNNNEINFYQQEQHFWSAICQETMQFGKATTAYFSELPIPAFSFIYLHADTEIADFTAANHQFAIRNKPYVLVVHENILPHVMPFIIERQYPSDGETTAMMLTKAELTKSADSTLPEGYTIVKCSQRLTDWAQPLNSAFGVPSDDTEEDLTVINEYIRYHQRALDRNVQLQHYVLLKDVQPVCSLTLTLNDKMARLDDIGTDTQYQRKGLATHLIKYALKECQQKGVESCFLEASSDGLSIYKKLGFTPLFQYHCFIVE